MRPSMSTSREAPAGGPTWLSAQRGLDATDTLDLTGATRLSRTARLLEMRSEPHDQGGWLDAAAWRTECVMNFYTKSPGVGQATCAQPAIKRRCAIRTLSAHFV